MTDSSVLAGVGRAVINVDITVCPCPPHGTATSVPIDQVLEETYAILHSQAYTPAPPTPIHASSCILSHMASGSVPAGVGSTLVCFCLATITIVTSPSAVTHVAIDKILGKGGKRGKTEEGGREEEDRTVTEQALISTGNGDNGNLSKNINFQANLFFLILRRNGGQREKGRREEGEREKGRGRKGRREEGKGEREKRRKGGGKKG